MCVNSMYICILHSANDSMAQLVARRIPVPKVGGSNPSGVNYSMYIFVYVYMYIFIYIYIYILKIYIVRHFGRVVKAAAC